ncbi:cytochrome P450, partial [Geopyxis carbonaria]
VYQIYFHPLSKFPGPKICALSNIPYSRWLLSGFVHLELQKVHERYGPFVRVGPTLISTASVEAREAIYGSNPLFLKSSYYDGLGSSDTTRNLNSERDPIKHARARKIMNMCFYSTALADQEPYIQNHVHALVAKLRSLGARNEGIEAGFWFHAFASDVVSDVALGESFHSMENEELHFWPASVSKFFYAVNVLDALRFYSAFYYLKRLAGSMKVLSGKTFETRRKLGQRLEHSSTDRKDYITVITGAKNLLSRDEIVIHSSSLIFGGSETVANALTCSMYCLSKYPTAYQKLATEVRNAFHSAEEITPNTTTKLPYLNAVINETLRIYPPVATGGYRISPGAMVGGYYVPKGTEIFAAYWALSRSEQYFHNATEFIPDRWIDAECKDNMRASQPFSMGPRNCVGRNLALLEYRLVLAQIFFNFDIELVDGELDFFKGQKNTTSWVKPMIGVRFMPREM